MSRIRARLDWTLPHDELLRFAQDKKLLDAQYISLSSKVSRDQNSQTMFDVVGKVSVERGEILFDVVRWNSTVAGAAMAMTYRGQALGYIVDGHFSGRFQAEYDSTFPAMLGLNIGMFGVGTFEVALDPR